ncbi:hypothetical protein LWI29_010441 [Acer saccharum]|uniref:Uncharacterized protein n=1 Tax=Acer saccharum TaxID=4024 RepID=A0AA39SDT5_ACESA|nr:hypothetical protein LWI29_010441 [Acer saccharum]
MTANAEKLQVLEAENAVIRATNEELFAEMEALIQRIPGVPAPIKKSTANSFADSPFVDAIAFTKMPRKFNFPNMKQYEGTTDPDDHIA